MFVRNIDGYTRIQGKTASLATAKLAIFATDILWESCSKLNFEQLSHTMSIVNVAILAVARKNMSIATNYEKMFFSINNIDLCINIQNSLLVPKSPPGDPISPDYSSFCFSPNAQTSRGFFLVARRKTILIFLNIKKRNSHF